MSTRYTLITGASGLLGSLVNRALQERGHTTIGLAHRTTPETNIVIRDPAEIAKHSHHLHTVINLAGLPILGRPWTRQWKERLITSRAGVTKQLLDTFREHDIKVEHLISGSAIGYYGATEQTCTEDSPAGDDFSAHLCSVWEAAAREGEDRCNHLTIIRTGLVLTEQDGFLKPFKLPSKMRLQLRFGDGRQWLSWIDYRDWLASVMKIIDDQLDGTFNLTAPEPVRQAEFSAALLADQSIKLPLWTPKFLFRPLGEMKTLLVEGQKVIPQQLQQAGFRFEYPTLTESLKTLPFPN